VWTVDGDDYYCRLPHDEKISENRGHVDAALDAQAQSMVFVAVNFLYST